MMRASALLQWGNTGQAAANLREAEIRFDSVSVQGLLPATQFPILKALVMVEDPHSLDASAADIDRYLAETERLYDHWRQSAPDNFEHWYQLLVAEQGRRAGDLEVALSAYDAALQAAQQQSCWFAVTLLARRAEAFWNGLRRHQFADVYKKQRYQALSLWRAQRVLVADEDASSSGVRAGEPSMEAVIKIAQALSLHTDLAELVPEIIRNVARETGAQRVALLLAREQDLQLAMDADPNDSHYYEVPSALDSVDALPQSVIRYVARTQRPLRCGAAEVQARPLLNNDQYVSRLASREGGFHGALWCVPLTYLGQLLGVIYLEHELVGDVFDERKESLVEFLAAQAAISVRNIELIKQLSEEGEARREAELRKRSADAELVAHRENEEKLEKLANTDALTGLPNRRWFLQCLEKMWRQEDPEKLGVMMLDIDRFKQLNDDYGHAVGDEVLSHLARTFHATLRSGDLAARLGGEEFAVLLRNGDTAEVLRVARRLRSRVAKTPLHLDGRRIAYTVSVGVDYLDATDNLPESALQRADEALYRAKRQGRNRVCC